MKKALEEGSRGAFPQAFGVVLGGNETVTRGESPDPIGQSLPPLQLEFAVQMTCQSCVDAVRKSLQGVAGKSPINFLWTVQSPLGESGTSRRLTLLPFYRCRN